jgi:hypothetical protein
VPETAPSVEQQAVILKAGMFGCLRSCCACQKLAPASRSEAGRVPPPSEGQTRKDKFLAMCASEADAITCFARFRACKKLCGWFDRFASDLSCSVLSYIMKRRISSARACVEVLRSFSTQIYTGGRSRLVLVVSVRLGEHKKSNLGAAWSDRSLPTCLRSWQARLAVQ